MSLQSTPRRSHGPKTYIRRRIAVTFALALTIFVLSTGWSLANAVLSPINDPVSAKIAEWARGHGLGSVVTGLEALQYKLNPPKVGGIPLSGLLKGQINSSASRALGAFALQISLPTIVTPGLSGEGRFKTLVKSHGMPLVQVAYLRPDSLHTSYLSAIVWMSGQHTRLEQHPGLTDPGRLSLWSKASSINRAAGSGLMAAFNSGFKIKDSRGGYFENGHTIGVLTKGAASLVVYRNGKSKIGAWDTQVRMSPDVLSVRQNLKLLIDNGRLDTNLDGAA